MPDYQNSKIYKVTCESGLVYIGSTTQTLKERLRQHKKSANECSCNKFINPVIELIEDIKCDTKKELLTRERYYIETLDCVNVYVPLQTPQEHYLKHRDRIRDNAKIYYQENKEEIIKRNTERNKGMDRREYYKKWRSLNPEKTKTYQLKKKLITKE